MCFLACFVVSDYKYNRITTSLEMLGKVGVPHAQPQQNPET